MSCSGDVSAIHQKALSALACVSQACEPGTCQQLFELCSDPDVLGCLFILAGSQLGLTAEKLEVAVWRTGLQDHVLLSLDNPQVIEFLRSQVLQSFPFENMQPPVRADAQAEDAWAVNAWVIAKRVVTVLRGALCGAGFAPAAAPDIVSEAATRLAAVLTCVSCDTISLILGYLSKEDLFSKGQCDLPLHLLHTLLLEVQTVVHAVHTCHSLLLELSPRALEMVAGVMSDLLDFFVPNFMPLLLEAGSIATTSPTTPSSANSQAGGGSDDQYATSGAKGGPRKGPAKASKGKGKGNARKNSSVSGSIQSPAAGDSTTTTGTAGAAGPVQQAESQADRELRIKRHDGRGLIVTAVDAWALAINIRCQHDKSICADQSVPGMAHTVADLLSELILVPPASLYGAPQHQAELKPITWAAQMCNGLEKRDKAVLMPSADSVWRPTCLSIGPAPVATAGAESVYNLAAFIQLAPDLIPPVIVVDCLRLTVQLTTLARRMAHEASDPEFKYQVALFGGDVYALRSWCATTGAICRTAVCQLATLQHMSRRGKLGEGAPPEQFQDESHLSSKEAQDKQKGAPLPLKEVQVLLPVMGAAALQLAHAALGCVRIMDTLVTNMNGPPAFVNSTLEPGRASAAELYSAHVSALELYVKLLSCAADKDIHAVDALAEEQPVSPVEGKASLPAAKTTPHSKKAESMPSTSRAAATPSATALTAAPPPSAAAAGSPAAIEASREGGPEGQLHVLPPSFARHCAAICAWGSSIRNLANIAQTTMTLLNTECMVGASEHLVSWLPGGTRTQQNLHVIDLLASFADFGADLMEVTGGDLAGWLGDLAPRGDLTSSQLLYRMCCTWERLAVIDHMPLGTNKGAWKAAKAAHRYLLPLLVLAYKVPQPVTAVPPAGINAQQQQGSQPSASSSRASSSAAAAAAKRAQQARDTLRAAVASSPLCLSAICMTCQDDAGMMESVFEKVEQRVLWEGDKGGGIYEWTRTWAEAGGLHNNPLASVVQEPLFRMLKAEEAVWSAAWEHNYNAKEEGQHIKRLQAYVQAAADRAASQLQGRPGLVQSLREALQS